MVVKKSAPKINTVITYSPRDVCRLETLLPYRPRNLSTKSTAVDELGAMLTHW